MVVTFNYSFFIFDASGSREATSTRLRTEHPEPCALGRLCGIVALLLMSSGTEKAVHVLIRKRIIRSIHQLSEREYAGQTFVLRLKLMSSLMDVFGFLEEMLPNKVHGRIYFSFYYRYALVSPKAGGCRSVPVLPQLCTYSVICCM